MKTLCIVTSYPLDEPVVKNRLTPIIGQAQSQGVTVNLVSPGSTVFEDFGGPNFHHKRIKHTAWRRHGFLLRALDEWILARKLLARKNIAGFDVVLLTIPSMFLLFCARDLGRQRCFLDVRDLTWEYLSDKNVVLRFAKAIFRMLARYGLTHVDYVTVTNAAERKYMVKEMNWPSDRISVLPNGISRAQFDALGDVVDNFDQGRSVQVSYIGNVGIAQNLATLLEAAKLLPEVKFNIVGNGTDFSRICGIHRDLNLANVELFGRIPWPAVLNVLRQTNILYAQLGEDYAGAMPSKLYEYLATNMHIIYGGTGEAVSVLARFDNVSIVPPDNCKALVSTIENVIASGAHLVRSMHNRNRVEREFIREAHVGDLFRHVWQKI